MEKLTPCKYRFDVDTVHKAGHVSNMLAAQTVLALVDSILPLCRHSFFCVPRLPEYGILELCYDSIQHVCVSHSVGLVSSFQRHRAVEGAKAEARIVVMLICV